MAQDASLDPLAALNPTVLVSTASSSSRPSPSALRPLYGASVAKQFTAFLAALLVDEGLWSPNDGVRNYVPELPEWADGIEIEHLVRHTSGLPVYQYPVEWANADMLNAIVHDIKPVRAPGVAWEYCGTGYILLALGIERVADCPIEELMLERLLRPVGMVSSQFATPPEHARVRGSEPATVGDGGLWTTALDLERWNLAMNERAFGPTVHDRVEQPGRLRDGSALPNNGWGVGLLARDRRTFVHRGGDVAGWTTKVVRERSTRTSVVLTTEGAAAQLVHDTAMEIAMRASSG